MTFATVCALALGAGIVTFRAQADEWDKKTIFTIDQPIQVTDTYLEPGTYVMKLANSSSDRNIIQIYDANQQHLINTVLAIPNYRVQRTGNTRFMFWETPPGTARAMRAWFYPGDNFGQEFRYPKHLHQLASLTTTTAQSQEPAAPAAAPAPVIPAPPVAVNQEPPAPPAVEEEEQQVVIAQNTPPPPPPEPEAAPITPTPAPEPATQELPKTATPLPWIGLGGLLSLALYGLLRVRRSA
jgi:hypothetical protein